MPKTLGRPTRMPVSPRTRGSARMASRPTSVSPNVLKARWSPRNRADGQGHEHGEGGRDQATEQHAERAVAPEDLAGDERADPDEEVLRERQLPRQPRDRDERQRDRGHHEGPYEVRLDVAGPKLASERDRHERGGRPDRSPQRGDPRLIASDHSPGRQSERGHEEHGEHQEEPGHREAHAEEDLARRPQPRHVRELLAQPEHQRADEGHRQVGQPSDHRGAVGVEHERVSTMALTFARREEHAAERSQAEPDHPAGPGDGHRADAVEASEVGVVDHRAHPGPEGRAEQEGAEAERAPRARSPHGRCGRS